MPSMKQNPSEFERRKRFRAPLSARALIFPAQPVHRLRLSEPRQLERAERDEIIRQARGESAGGDDDAAEL